MSKVHRFELRAAGQVVEIPFEEQTVATVEAPNAFQKVFGSDTGRTVTERLANQTNTSWIEFQRRVGPRHHANGFVCPVLLPHKDLTVEIVAFDKGNTILWQRNFYKIDLAADAQFLYYPGLSGVLLTEGGSRKVRVQAALKEGGEFLDDIVMSLKYNIEPKLLKPKNQGPNNFVAGRFIYLRQFSLAMKSVLVE
jgi:hypothetical protein